MVILLVDLARRVLDCKTVPIEIISVLFLPYILANKNKRKEKNKIIRFRQ